MTTETLNPDLAALADLAAQADTGTTAAPAAEAQVVEAAPPSQADQLAGILMMLGNAGAMRFPSLASVFTEAKCRAHGEAMAPALERLGWNLNAGETMVFLTAAGSAIMLLVETRNTILADLKTEQTAKQLKAATPATDGAQKVAQATADAVATGPEVAVHSQMKLYAQK